jgi:hypothetical protein
MDPIFRALDTQTTSFALVNADGSLTSAYDADPRGNTIEVERYDEESGFVLSRFVGQITQASLSPTLLTLASKNVKRAVLEQVIPSATITTTLFPEAPSVSLGKVIPVLFGTATNVPLYCIVDDLPGSRFIYLAPLAAGVGSITVNALRRDGVGGQQFANIGAGEYTVNTVLYPGYTVIVFPLRQTRFGGTELHDLWGDFSGPAADRNFSRARRNILTRPWAGLNQTVSAESWDAAEAALDAIGSLYADGVLSEQRQAQDVLAQLGMPRGLMLGLDLLGRWTESVDAQQTSFLTLRDGAGEGVTNLVSCEDRERIAEEDRTKEVILKYRRDLIDGTLRYEQRRTVTANRGKDLILENDFIRDHTTADKTTHYLKGRIGWSESTIRATTPQEAREADVGKVVTLTFAPVNVTNGIFEIREVEDRLTTVDLHLQGGVQADYNAIYAYVAGTLPPNGPDGFATDYSRTAPNAATGLSISSSGVEQDAEGNWSAFSILAWTAPTTNLLHSLPMYRIDGESTWVTGPPITGTGALTAKIPGLISNKVYDYRVRTVNQPGTLTTDSTILENQTAPRDQVAPATPTGLAASLGTGAGVSLDWADNAETDLDEYFVFANSVDSGWPVAPYTDATLLIAKIKASRFVDVNAPIGALRYYRILAEDTSSNKSAPTATVSERPTAAASGPTPATPAAPTLSSSGTYQGTDTPGNADGTTFAFAVVTVAALGADTAFMETGARVFGGGEYVSVGQSFAAGGGTLRIDGGLPGWKFEVAQRAVGAFGKQSAWSTALVITAPGDTTSPSTPTSIVVKNKNGKNITFGWTPPTDVDLSEYEYQIRTASSSANASGAGSLSESGKAGARATDKSLTLEALTYGTTYHFRLRAKDYTGNPTTADGAGALWSATISFSLVRIDGSANLGSGTVGTTEVAANAISISPTRSQGSSSFSTTSTSFVDATGVTKSYDSVAGGALVVLVKLPLGVRNTSGSAATVAALAQLVETTVRSNGGVAGEVVPASGSIVGTVTMMTILPSTTIGATYTYQVQIKAGGSSTTAFLDSNVDWEIDIVELKR